ncbi:MAG: ribonuclease III [Alphaproteobacteria bacterium]|nr:ribonuclease III [Alphaproteobacteria bacterium]
MTDLAAALGHVFERPELLEEAVTHRSAGTPNLARFSYERLEFLGDRVLGLVVADLLLEMHPDASEGDLARRLTALVRSEALQEVAAGLELGQYLRLSDNEMRMGGQDNPGIQADACEALIGALYLDGGLGAARRFIGAKWGPLLREPGTGTRDPKTRLQEWAQGNKLPLPDYRVITEEGPAHEPHFTVEVTVEGRPPARARARSKRRAEQNAARKLLAVIEKAAGAEAMGDD